jgi:hypothetical protein
MLALAGCSEQFPSKYVATWVASGDQVELLKDGTAIVGKDGTEYAGTWKPDNDDGVIVQMTMHGTTAVVRMHLDGERLVATHGDDIEYLVKKETGMLIDTYKIVNSSDQGLTRASGNLRFAITTVVERTGKQLKVEIKRAWLSVGAQASDKKFGKIYFDACRKVADGWYAYQSSVAVPAEISVDAGTIPDTEIPFSYAQPITVNIPSEAGSERVLACARVFSAGGDHIIWTSGELKGV